MQLDRGDIGLEPDIHTAGQADRILLILIGGMPLHRDGSIRSLIICQIQDVTGGITGVVLQPFGCRFGVLRDIFLFCQALRRRVLLLVCLIFKGIRFRSLLFRFRLPGLLFGSLFRRICQVPSVRLFCFGVTAKVVCLLFLRISRLNLRSGGFCFQIRAVGIGLFLHILCCSLLRFRCHDRLHGRKRGHTDRGCQQNSGRPA